MKSISERMASWVFWPLAAATRPYGGLRPHRFMHWLGKLAAGRNAPSADAFRWCTDRHGCRMNLHPYFLIDRHIIAFGEYESPLQRFMASHIQRGMICLDVGANIGAVTVPLARLCGDSGKVYAFEPNPPVTDRLRQHVLGNSLNNVKIEPCALSDCQGNLSMATASSHHENQGMSSLVEFSHRDLNDTVNVPVCTLDDYVAMHGINRIDFIKVDIQGAEPMFIAGAESSIKKFKPTVAIELAPSSLAGANTTAADIIRQLNLLGLDGFELTASGKIGNRIIAADLPETYAAENALFKSRSN